MPRPLSPGCSGFCGKWAGRWHAGVTRCGGGYTARRRGCAWPRRSRVSYQEILTRLDLAHGALTGGDLEVTTPVDGSVIASLSTPTPQQVDQVIREATKAFGEWRMLNWRCHPRTQTRRARASARRGASAVQGGPRCAGVPRERKNPSGRVGRSAGDDRHLRLRRGPVAAALRVDHCLRASWARHAGDLASRRCVRHHHRVQLPRCGLVLERGASARVRRPRRVETV